LISKLKPGAKICDIYNSTKEFIAAQNPSLKINSNFGFGIGFQFQESNLIINETNQLEVQDGMTFHVRITFTGINQDPARSIVAIGDTVIVKKTDTINMTQEIARKYSEISYILEDLEEEPQPKPQSAAAKKPEKSGKKPRGDESSEYDDENESQDEEGSEEILKSGLNGNLTTSRLRSKANN